MSWLDNLYALVETGERGEAIDLLFDQLDLLWCAGELEKFDRTLDEIDVERLDTHLLVGVLSFTRWGKLLLCARPRLVERIEDRIRRIDPSRLESLMSGLR